jgi:amino acid transporter
MGDKSREELIRQDVEDLRKLGYAQQLFREMGGFSNFAISFSIISVLTGAILLYGYGLKFAGPIINTVGWPVVSLFTLCVAASMAELASVYPTAGGLYFWAYRLGGRGWAWVTAWFNMIGQVTATAGINVAAAIYIIGAVTRMFDIPDDTVIPIFGKLTNWYFQLFVMVLITTPQVLVNIFGIRATARLNDFSVWWHVGGVFVIALLLTIFGSSHNEAGFLLKSTTVVNPLEVSSAELSPGNMAPALVVGELKVPSPLFSLLPGLAELYRIAPFGLVFVLALLQAQWTYTGYDASAHTAEETVMAKLNSAWGIFLSVAVSAVVGYVLLLVLTWCIPRGDVARTATDAYPVLYIVYENLGRFFANTIAVIIGVAMWLCGASSITSMSRMWYAFARDGGVPASRWISRISPRYRTPVWSIVITTMLSIAICVYAAAFSVVTSISTVTLYLAYVIPVYLNWRNRRRKAGEFASPANAAWNLGGWAPLINVIAIGWTIFVTIIFSMPPNELVLWSLILLGLGMAFYWRFAVRGRFRGPATVAIGNSSDSGAPSNCAE